MFLSLLALIVSQQPELPVPEKPTVDQLQVAVREDSVGVAWRDTEDVLSGELTPWPAHAGEPLVVTVLLGAIDGREVTGPVTLTLRPVQHVLPEGSELFAPKNIDGHSPGIVMSAVKTKGAPGYRFELTPEVQGLHDLEFSFRTTRQKIARGQVEIGRERNGALPFLIFAALIGVIVVIIGAARVLSSPEKTPTAEGTGGPTPS